MIAKEQLLREIQHSPEPLIKEVLDFLLFARSRNYPFAETEGGDRQIPQQPIWEFAQELMRDAPPEELVKLPEDSARNHDHYLYGAPKQPVVPNM